MDTTGDGEWNDAEWDEFEDWRMSHESDPLGGCWTPDDRKRYNLLALEKAWTDEGIQPWYHRRMKRWLKRRWPVLYRAIEDVVDGMD